jgi:hypothetical protein
MASIIGRISRFARSPQGRQLTQKAAQMAKDPATRAKIEDARRRFAQRKPRP